MRVSGGAKSVKARASRRPTELTDGGTAQLAAGASQRGAAARRSGTLIHLTAIAPREA